MAGGHHGSFAGRFFQVAGFGGAAGASAGVLPAAVGDATPDPGAVTLDAPLATGTSGRRLEAAGTGAVERAPSPSEGEGRGEGEDVGVLVDAEAPEAGGRSPSPRPSPARRGGDAGSVWAEVAFILSAGKETTALVGTVTAMVGAWSLCSSRGMKTVAPESAMLGGSLAGRSGAREAAGAGVSGLGFDVSAAGEWAEGVFPVVSAALEAISGVGEVVSAALKPVSDVGEEVSDVFEEISAVEEAFTTQEDTSIAPEDAKLAAEDGRFWAEDDSAAAEDGLDAMAVG